MTSIGVKSAAAVAAATVDAAAELGAVDRLIRTGRREFLVAIGAIDGVAKPAVDDATMPDDEVAAAVFSGLELRNLSSSNVRSMAASGIAVDSAG